mmetsp:Transcript_34072/g.50571  ORF Transcript_34072/g.50571 Transcript_34072/m.50571 type:complete len:154 (+) Transcript_34072:95-556(+)
MKVTMYALATAFATVSTNAFVPTIRGVATRSVVPSFGVSVGNTVTSSTTARFMSADSAMEFAKSEIDSNDVVVFSKSFCPFCKKTKKLFTNLKVDATVYELNEMDDGGEIQDALEAMTGQRTVPNVFIKGKHLGGNDATQAAAKSGELQEMLN